MALVSERRLTKKMTRLSEIRKSIDIEGLLNNGSGRGEFQDDVSSRENRNLDLELKYNVAL